MIRKGRAWASRTLPRLRAKAGRGGHARQRQTITKTRESPQSQHGAGSAKAGLRAATALMDFPRPLGGDIADKVAEGIPNAEDLSVCTIFANYSGPFAGTGYLRLHRSRVNRGTWPPEDFLRNRAGL